MPAAGLCPGGGVRSDSPEAVGARWNACQAQGRSGQPLSSGCLPPAAPWEDGGEETGSVQETGAVRGDRPGWTVRAEHESDWRERRCVSDIPEMAQLPGARPPGRRPRLPTPEAISQLPAFGSPQSASHSGVNLKYLRAEAATGRTTAGPGEEGCPVWRQHGWGTNRLLRGGQV